MDATRTSGGGRRELRKLNEYLWEDEQVRLMATGYYGSGQGLLTLTNRRLIFIRDGVMSKTTEDFPLAKISSVQWSSGLLDAVRHLTSASVSAPQPAPTAPAATSVADQIRQLADTPGPREVKAPYGR